MGFTSGSKVLADIIDEIADGLIASSSYWNDGDTSWDTSDRSEGYNNARRCLKYTGDTDDIWIALEAGNKDTYLGSGEHTKGLRLVFSASWDDVNHTYSDTALNESYTYIQFETEADGYADADLSTLMLTYYLWIDSSGFALMAKPEPFSGDDYQSSFICVLEHMDTKEYSDGLTNFYSYAHCNKFERDHGGSGSNGDGFAAVVRPFAYMGDTDNNKGIMFWRDSIKDNIALKSTGNGKVYYVKPVICNSLDNMTPIYQSELFWKYNGLVGLVDGDVVAVDGQTTKYLCKALTSPDSTNVIYYAIKYVA